MAKLDLESSTVGFRDARVDAPFEELRVRQLTAVRTVRRSSIEGELKAVKKCGLSAAVQSTEEHYGLPGGRRSQ
jgi:hypothetical protein